KPHLAEVNFPLPVIQSLPKVLPESDYRVTAVVVDRDVISIEPGDTRDACYGVAIDVGTTTVAGALLDLNTGEQLATSSALNAQSNYGADVIARSALVMNEPWGQEKMQEMVVASLNNILEQLQDQTGIPAEQI